MRSDCFPHPERGDCRLYEHSLRLSIVAYTLPSPSLVGRRFCFAPLTTNDRYGCRCEECQLQFHSTFRVIAFGASLAKTPRTLGSPVPLYLRLHVGLPGSCAGCSGSSRPVHRTSSSNRRETPISALLPPIEVVTASSTNGSVNRLRH